MLHKLITTQDVHAILKEVTANLPSHKYDVGQKVISELCSKLTEQITAQHFAKKLNVDVVAGKHDVDPDVLFKFRTDSIPLEIKVAQTTGAKCNRVKFRGGGLTDRSCDYLFIARNKECTEFFVALCHTTKADWVAQKTTYFAPSVVEETLFVKNATVLWGSFSTQDKGKRQGKPIIKLEEI